MTIEDVNTRNFTFCQAFFDKEPTCRTFIVDAFRTKEAKEKAEKFVIERWEKPREICYYPRNYIRKARELFKQGLHN